MAETYFLKLMGFPELHRPDGRPVKLKVRKHLALLIYLVMDGRALYFRDELAELLWPGVPAENSRHSLSMAFSVLRGLFGADCIKGNHAEVQFRAPRLGLDLDRIEAGEILGSATALPLEVDGFLRGFHIEDAPAFQHWRDRRHAQLLPLIQAAMLTLVDQARRSADLSRMLAMADRLLALDPLAEEGIRARMEAFAIQGDRVSALREFEGWKRELDREIGAVPSELLEAMAARLRRGIQSPSAPVQLRESDGGLAMPRFIGRAAEYGVLFEAWERTTQLNTRHVLLTGETGIGKSTLAMRFAAAAALEGAAVARVQCFELEQRMAFGMIGALVTPLLELPGVLGTAPESLAEVARMVPKVREKFPHLPAPRHSEGEAARLHFAEGTLALLDAIMEEQPILLIVDDYPRSDEASLSVLHLLLRRAVNDRLMVVLSGRPPEEDESPQAARIRQGVPHLPLDRIELTPLAGEECDELLGALLSGVGREPGSPERRAILRTAGGNPMALELLTQDWLTHGDAALAVLLPAMGDDVPGSALEAVGYDRLIERMLPTMTPRTRVALYLAAILGPRLNELECFEVLDFTAGQTMAALSELVQQRVLRNTARGLEFVNELIRARLYLKIPTAARVRLHHAVADRLLAAVAGGEEVPGLEIAWHCIRARRREEATPFLMNGAREAITHGAPDEAARALSSAIGQLKGRAKAEATLLLAETYQEMAEWGDALECVRDISQDHKSDPSVREVADILELSSNLQLDAYPIEEIPALVQDLALRTATYEEPRARARAASWAACLAASLRREDLLLSVREALSRIELAQLDPRDQSLVWMARAMVFYNTRERKAGIEALRTASSQARSIGTLDSTFVHIHTGFGTLVLSEGRYGEAAESLHIAYKAATRLDNMPLITQAAANLSLCYYRLGNHEETLKWAMTAWNRSSHTRRAAYPRIHAAARCALSYASIADAPNARHWLEHLCECGAESSLAWERQAAVLFAADVHWLLRNERTALGLVESILAGREPTLLTGFVGPMARWMTVWAVRSGKPMQARKVLRKLYPRLMEFDALDQAEVLCSLIRVGAFDGERSERVNEEARLALGRLPIACSKQIQELGLLLPC